MSAKPIGTSSRPTKTMISSAYQPMKTIASKSHNSSTFLLDYIDSYKGLVYKAMAWMNWVVKKCMDVDFIVKTDDDILINLFPLAKYLKENEALKKEAKYHCLFWSENGMVIDRNPDSKW